MTDKIPAITGAVNTTELVFSKMEQYFNKVQEMIELYGGDAVDLGLNALRIDAAAKLLLPVVCIMVLLLILKFLLPFYIIYLKPEYKEHRTEGVDVIMVFGGLGFIVCLMPTLSSLLNMWLWVGLFYPELYAVYKFTLQ